MVVVLSPEAVPSLRMTVDEYLEAHFPEGFRYELVDGEVIVSLQPELPHDLVVDELMMMLADYRRAHKGAIRLLSLHARVPIPGTSRVREPDFALYGPWKGHPTGGRGWRLITPFLVIEVVSPEQGRRDYEDKVRDYWKTGTGEYWIVDPQEDAITVLRRGRTRWLRRTYGRGDSFEAACLPGLVVDVTTIMEADSDV